MRSVTRDEQGFTLIEVLVAATVLLVGILGVATMVNASNAGITSSKAREQGTALGRDLIESARSVRYQALRPSAIVPTLQGMPGLAKSGGGSGWTIKRRGIIYTVAVGVCSVDDPGDGTGAHTADTFCLNSSVQATAAECKSMLGSPPKISGVSASGAKAGDCGIDTNLDGQVDNLVASSATTCPAGTSVGAGTCDAQPDDFKRLVVLVTWDRGSGSRYVLQQATVPFPGLSAYGAISGLTLQGYTNNNDVYTVPDKPSSLHFDVTSSQNANQVDWLLGGVDQGALSSWSGTSGSFDWNLGNDAPDSETTPAVGEVVDGTYTVGARVQDAGGIHGIEKDVTVIVNRRIPFPPTGFLIAGTGPVTATWGAPADQDIIGYTLFRKVGGSEIAVCSQITARTCVDSNPPAGTVTYYVKAIDRDSAGAARVGQPSLSKSVTVGNSAPTAPTWLTPTSDSYKVTGGGSGLSKVQLTWNAASDSDGTIDTYEIWRSGCGASTLIGSALGTVTTLTDTAAPKATSCTYTVRAKDNGGLYGPFTPDLVVDT